jgi:hypothetical protein
LKFKKNSSSTVIVPNISTVESPTIRPPDVTLNALNAPAARDQSPHHMLTDSLPTQSPVAMEPRDRFPPLPQVPQYVSIFTSRLNWFFMYFSRSTDDPAEEFLSSMLPSLPGYELHSSYAWDWLSDVC